MILITGATGRTGKEAALLLAKQGVKVRALVRNPEKAAPLQAAGVELAVGDAGDATSVRAALRGVDKIAIILPNGETAARIREAARDARGRGRREAHPQGLVDGVACRRAEPDARGALGFGAAHQVAGRALDDGAAELLHAELPQQCRDHQGRGQVLLPVRRERRRGDDRCARRRRLHGPRLHHASRWQGGPREPELRHHERGPADHAPGRRGDLEGARPQGRVRAAGSGRLPRPPGPVHQEPVAPRRGLRHLPRDRQRLHDPYDDDVQGRDRARAGEPRGLHPRSRRGVPGV